MNTFRAFRPLLLASLGSLALGSSAFAAPDPLGDAPSWSSTCQVLLAELSFPEEPVTVADPDFFSAHGSPPCPMGVSPLQCQALREIAETFPPRGPDPKGPFPDGAALMARHGISSLSLLYSCRNFEPFFIDRRLDPAKLSEPASAAPAAPGPALIASAVSEPAAPPASASFFLRMDTSIPAWEPLPVWKPLPAFAPSPAFPLPERFR